MCNVSEGLENCRRNGGADSGENGERRSGDRKKGHLVRFILLIIILILILLCLRSCRARDEPVPEDVERVYEEDHSRESGSFVPAAEGGRLNLAVSECYRITDERPYFYIGFPKENVYDVVFTLKDADGNELYRTDYVSAGTNVAIDGTAFLPKGEQEVDCLVSIYDRDSGALVSDCTTVVLNVSYQ